MRLAFDLLRSSLMKLPGGESAVVDIAKLRDYCLSAPHKRGRHKARVFTSVLGITRDDAEFLRDALLRAAHDRKAKPGEGSQHLDYLRRRIGSAADEYKAEARNG